MSLPALTDFDWGVLQECRRKAIARDRIAPTVLEKLRAWGYVEFQSDASDNKKHSRFIKKFFVHPTDSGLRALDVRAANKSVDNNG